MHETAEGKGHTDPQPGGLNTGFRVAEESGTRGGHVHVQLVQVSKAFGGVQALRDVSLSIRRGSIHAFVGENGAGKSTLGKIIAGIIAPDRGQLIVNGRTVRYSSPRDALADGITIIAQEMVLVPQMTVLDNVFLGLEDARAGVVSKVALVARYDALTRKAGFHLPPHALVRNLSVADQQRVEILRALARNAEFIIMDEPTAALTKDESDRLHAVVRSLNSEGKTIVFVSHFLEDVLQLADTVSIFKDGALVRTSSAEAETPASLVQGMTGREVDLAFPPIPLPPPQAPVVFSAKGLGRRGVLRDISFEIRAGEILGIAGLIGSGRTELARLIFGIDRSDEGVMLLDGKRFNPRTPREALESGIALIPESRKEQGLVMLRSIVENVTMPHLSVVSYAGVVRNRFAAEKVAELLSRVDVRAHDQRSAVATLSGGNQQKTLFAKWLLRPPRLLIADEPTRGVDVGSKRSIYELLVALAGGGMAVLLISSEMEEVLGLSHRLLVMRKGTIVARFNERPFDEGEVMWAAFGAQGERHAEEDR